MGNKKQDAKGEFVILKYQRTIENKILPEALRFGNSATFEMLF
jgi:hypothetical protein